MNRSHLQQLAGERIEDARTLLSAGRWPGAYYLAGYAVECGLKSCILAHVAASGIIFQDRKYSERCWTHSIAELVKLAGLEKVRDDDIGANRLLGQNWVNVQDWSETSRYVLGVQQAQALALFDAVTDPANGVLPWIRNHW